jgi:diaminopimelate epimerase
MPDLSFIKMHGLGNDFVVVDSRRPPISIDGATARALADRHTGIGCDQVLVIEPPRNDLADVFLRIHNPDGGEAEACGNGTRCVASLIMDENGKDETVIETVVGLLDATRGDDGLVSVDMGLAALDWRDIPLSAAVDTLHLDVAVGLLRDPVGVNVGNPHAVFFVDDAEAVPLADLGPEIERHSLFPEFTNVEAAQILAPDLIRMRVWERGAGITRACGSGACATLVAAHRRGLTGRNAEVIADGGRLGIEWLKDDHVLMSGPVATSFSGTVDVAGLAGAGLAGAGLAGAGLAGAELA